MEQPACEPGAYRPRKKHFCRKNMAVSSELECCCNSNCAAVNNSSIVTVTVIAVVMVNTTGSVDKKNQLDATFCILYFSSNSCSTCFGQPCAHHQELTTA